MRQRKHAGGRKGTQNKNMYWLFSFFQKTRDSFLEGFLGAQAPRTRPWQACEAAGHTAFTVSKQRAMNAGAQLALSFLFHLRPQPTRNALPDTLRDAFPW